MNLQADTIAAISTPPGTGGIAVIRISGSSAISVADKVFSGSRKISSLNSHSLAVGRLVDSATAQKAAVSPLFLDEVVVGVFRAPNSYTMEDVVEISCHGGRYLTSRLVEMLIEHGVRQAEPGEFTQRAFLNGRLDLSQAEAVGDIINAKTAASLKSAISQFTGELSKQIKAIRKCLIDCCSLLELELDFAEEEVEFADRQELKNSLTDIQNQLGTFAESYRRGKILRDGVKVVIMGKPNVGKSSLLNGLLKEERAIVSEIAGTTRDVIEEQLDIRGVLFRIIDTAGVRATGDQIEQIGVARTYKQIEHADIVLFLFDGSSELDEQDEQLLEKIESLETTTQILAIINKCDQERVLLPKNLGDRFNTGKVLEISALTHQGFENLERELLARANLNESTFEPMITNARQKKAVDDASGFLRRAKQSLSEQMSGEFIAVDLHAAIRSLGEIIGQVTSEDILSNIFSKFCIGK